MDQSSASATTGVVLRSVGLPPDDIVLFDVTGSSTSNSAAYSGISSVEYDGAITTSGVNIPLTSNTGNGLIILFGSNDTAIFGNIPSNGRASIIGNYGCTYVIHVCIGCIQVPTWINQ